jgi:hypothetical protein
MSRARAIRSATNLPPELWAECVLTAVYLKNLSATHAIPDKTPSELWLSRKPDLSHLREIGCRAFVLIQNHHNPKIYDQSIECVLIGYSSQSNVY